MKGKGLGLEKGNDGRVTVIPGWSLVTKAALGGRAKHWAVMGVKSEQASKVEMRAPTRRIIGEGRVEGEGIDMRTLYAPVFSFLCRRAMVPFMDPHRAIGRRLGCIDTPIKRGPKPEDDGRRVEMKEKGWKRVMTGVSP